jgi:hypothetical protein
MWYAFIVLSLGMIALLVSEGCEARKYTSSYKFAVIILQIPTFYFLISTLMGGK